MIKDYIWLTKSHERKNMYDMTEKEIQEAHDHCTAMLYNKNKVKKGRYYVIKDLQKEIIKCNAELAVRWFLAINGGQEYSRARLSMIISNIQIKDQETPATTDQLKSLTLTDVFNSDSIPAEFHDLTMYDFLKACKPYHSQHSIYNYKSEILQRIGIKFTSRDLQLLSEKGYLTIEDKLQYVKKELGFSYLYLSNKGLTYSQFKVLKGINNLSKIEDLSKEQLTLLRDVVINELIENLQFEIKNWENIMAQLETVAESKNYSIN